jgi:hypothetical protein
VLRDLVWGQLHGRGFFPTRVREVDVVFFDPGRLEHTADDVAMLRLRQRAPAIGWKATNQAAVHRRHDRVGGDPVPPLPWITGVVAGWPEPAVSVAVRLTTGGLQICAPLGLDDLLGGVWRRNPAARITVAASRERLARQQPGRQWPHVRVIDPQADP